MATKKKAHANQTIAVAKSDDGEIQITFTILWEEVKKAQDKAIQELAEDVTAPGFRKGKAPKGVAKSHIPQSKLIEKTLGKLLPELLTKAIADNKIKPVIYPKFEAIKIEDGSDWQIRAVTCELAPVELGSYKALVEGALRGASLKKELSKEEKQNEVIKSLLEGIKLKVPQILIREEVDARLTELLARIEKLGLKIESYLASMGKDPETLRKEYETDAMRSISIELILNEIANKEGVVANEEEVAKAIEAAGAGDKALTQRLDTPEQRNIIRSILRRRVVLDSLSSLI